MLDLHCHSTASDGIYTPEELAIVGYEKHLTAMALTDHDTLDGVSRFLRRTAELSSLLKQEPFRAIAGIEFSTINVDDQRMHLLGLFVNPENPALLAAASQNVAWRNERNAQILDRINENNMTMTLEEVQSFCGGDVLGRPHFAAAMTAKGYCRSTQDAFTRFLGYNCPCYVNRQTVPLADCIRIIHEAGGLAIWAHPFSRANLTYAHFCEVLGRLFMLGLDGAEAYHPAHSSTQTSNVVRATRERGMLCSGGSDSHGPRFANQYIGEGNRTVEIPDRILPPMLKALERYA